MYYYKKAKYREVVSLEQTNKSRSVQDISDTLLQANLSFFSKEANTVENKQEQASRPIPCMKILKIMHKKIVFLNEERCEMGTPPSQEKLSDFWNVI